MELCFKQVNVASEVQTRNAWSLVLNHHLELLRLFGSRNKLLRWPTPFLLLFLDRDDDAYCFCRHWLGRARSDENHLGEVRELASVLILSRSMQSETPHIKKILIGEFSRKVGNLAETIH